MSRKAKSKSKLSHKTAAVETVQAYPNRLTKWFGVENDGPLDWGVSGGFRRLPNCVDQETPVDQLLSGLEAHNHPVESEEVFRLLERLWCLPIIPPESRSQLVNYELRLVEAETFCEIDESASSEEVLLYQMSAVELPLTWAVISVSAKADAWGRLAADRMADLVRNVLDADGIPGARILPVLGSLLGSWTRCHRLMGKLGYDFNTRADEIMEWLVRQVLRFLGPDGTLMLCGQSMVSIDGRFRKFLLKMSHDRTDKFLAKRSFPPAKQGRSSRRKLPAESSHSEWGEIALMQSRWASGAPKVGIDFSKGRNRIQLAAQKDLLEGDVTPQVSINGKPIGNATACEVVCWHQDEDVDYLELKLPMSDGVQVQRQFVLVRDDQIMIVMDVVNCPAAARIDYHCSYPFAEGISALPESETSEVYLRSGAEIQSLVMPLGLSEWKVARSDDAFRPLQDRVEIHQTINGTGLCSILMFDLNPSRSIRPRTWRQLHVAEQLQHVGCDQAVAFRAQIDQQQWLIYRSIGENANRTFMGENFSKDFFLGRFDRSGAVEELIGVEP